jgi:hypothetical protein
MSLGTRYKDPDEIRLFTFDWTRHLGADTIAEATVTIPVGLTKVGVETIADDNKQVSVFVSGGTANAKYTVTNHITTSTGETLQRSGVIAVRHA